MATTRKMLKRTERADGTFLEPEYCDDCGALVGIYDSAMPEGEKIIITDPCGCWK